MFLDFWKLREQPFGMTPDPRYLYFSPGHREALASLFYGIETGRGFLSLIAPPGMGKTALLFQLLQRWKGYIHSAFLFQTQCNSRELIRYLLDDLGLKNDDEDMVRMHSELNEFLFRETKDGRRVVVFIDEAQNLSDTVMETVRMLSNFEAPDRKLLQIVLAGQTELAQRLARPNMVQLRQRIAVQARLDPLPPEEVCRYVRHRLQVAGYEGTDLFTPGALAKVTELTQGVPRLINVLCFNALSLAFALRREQISSDIVREAAKDSTLELWPGSAPLEGSRAAPSETRTPPVGHLPRRSWWGRAKQRLKTGGVLRTTAFSLMLGGVAVYVGTQSRGVKANRSTERSKPAIITPTNAPALTPTSVLPLDRGAAEPAPEPASPETAENTRRSFVYVVQPHDTIREICRSNYTPCDENAIKEILKLNPGLKNPSRLDVGQEIHLPLSSDK